MSDCIFEVNDGDGSVDTDSMVLVDKMPAEIEF